MTAPTASKELKSSRPYLRKVRYAVSCGSAGGLYGGYMCLTYYKKIRMSNLIKII